MNLLSLHPRLNEIFEERDSNFPRRDPANTAAMKAALEAYMDALRASRNPAWRPESGLLAQARRMAENAVFVCGYMKSGTTLVVGLLDGHPELTVLPGDSHMMNVLSRQRNLRYPQRVLDQDRYWIARIVNPLGQKPFWFLGEDDRPYLEFIRYLEYWLAELPAADRSPFLAVVLALHCANPRRARRPTAWVEKTPGNERRVREILRLYPSARFVHIIRNPFPNVASVKQLCRHRGWTWNVAATAWGIRRAMRAGIANQKRLGKDRYYLLRYEDLVSEPEGEMRKIASFLGISWDESLLQPTLNGVLLGSNSMYSDRRVRGEILSAPPDRGVAELTRAEQFVVTTILNRTARHCGYQWGRPMRRLVSRP